MNPPTTQGEQTRAAIIEAAHGLFLQQGYNGTGMRQIAQAAGIQPASIYNHFTNKEAIFAEVAKEYGIYQAYAEALSQATGDTVADLIADQARRFAAGLAQRADDLRILFVDVVELDGQTSRAAFEQAMPFMVEFMQRLYALAPDGQALVDDIPPPTLMRALLGMFVSYFMTQLVLAPDDPALSDERWVEHFTRIFLYGALRRPEE
ncbi:MAG: TetR/AcrR family transcriptional regulator [Chloroflexi bacterium]|nr:TetR/AcrR family transcriptional regulator [Chloroflexota bacterium]MBU1751809.1 TetR/AcrR family transcriptional regulator [Chloroflexota bacterium]